MTKIKILRKNYDESIDSVFEVNIKFIAVKYIKEAIANEQANEEGNYKIIIQNFAGDFQSFTNSERSCKNIICHIIQNCLM